MATTERYQGKDGQRQERTDWHTIVVWGNRAEALNKILRKGRTIYVEGRIQTRSYEKNGEKKWATDINANQILLIGGGKREDGEERSERTEERKPAAPPSNNFDDDDVPF